MNTKLDKIKMNTLNVSSQNKLLHYAIDLINLLLKKLKF